MCSALTYIGCVEPPNPSSTKSKSDQDMMTLLDMPVDSDGVDMVADLGVDMPDAQPDQGMMTCDDTTHVATCASDGLSYTICEDAVLTIQSCEPWESCKNGLETSAMPSCTLIPSCLVAPGDIGEACERQYLLPGAIDMPEKGYQYGKEIALSGDELHMWIAAPNDTITGITTPSTSQVYRFSRPDTTQPFTYIETVGDAFSTEGAEWGNAISVNEDGSRAIVCGQKFKFTQQIGPGQTIGKCVLFEIESGHITKNTQLLRDEVLFFGSDAEISPDGNWIIVGGSGSKQVFIYNASDLQNPVHTFSHDDTRFGIKLDVYWEPSTNGYQIKLVIGALGDTESTGSAYWTTMTLSPNTGSKPELMPLTIPMTGVEVRSMGNQVTFNNDGRLIAVSASQTLLTKSSNTHEAGIVIVYQTEQKDGLTNPKVIAYPDFTEHIFKPAFGSALHFDERDWLWIGARNHETFSDGEEDGSKHNGEGRVYIYRQTNSLNEWTKFTHIDGMFENNGMTKRFDGYGSTLSMFEENGHMNLIVGGSSSNKYYTLGGQVTLIDVGTPQALNALD